jgi:hypothetical protein
MALEVYGRLLYYHAGKEITIYSKGCHYSLALVCNECLIWLSDCIASIELWVSRCKRSPMLSTRSKRAQVELLPH